MPSVSIILLLAKLAICIYGSYNFIDKTQVTQNPLCHQLIASDQEDNYFKQHSRKYEKVQMYLVVPGIGGLRGGGKWNVVKANPVNNYYVLL